MKIIKYILLFLIAFSIILGVFYGLDKILGLNNTDNIVKLFREKVGIEEKEEVVVDTTPPEITFDESESEILESYMSMSIFSNEKILIPQSNRYKLVPIVEEEKFEYVLEAYNIGIGKSTLKVTFADESGNETSIEKNVNHRSFGLPLGADFIEPWENSSYVADGDNLLAPMSKQRRLTSSYAPENLVDLNKDYFLYTNAEGLVLKIEAAESLKAMLTTMQTEIGKNLVIASAYRSYNNQVETYSSWVKKLGQEQADTISARPGYSEHQLGTVVDFVNEETGFDFTEEFANTAAGKWLEANSEKFGFIESYPKNSTDITDYAYEPWHYRYIGVDNAKAVKESGLTWPQWMEQELQKLL